MFNFFIVFFANHILPGIDVVNQTKLPHIGGDLMFAIALGFINSLIYPLLKVFHQATVLKIAGLSLVVNFISYAILKLLPIGIHVTSFIGYLSAALLVSFGSFILNVLEMKYKKHRSEPIATGAGSSDFPSMPPGP
jgi:uncharacterized membrane protein YvlD (DUF360 family)